MKKVIFLSHKPLAPAIVLAVDCVSTIGKQMQTIRVAMFRRRMLVCCCFCQKTINMTVLHGTQWTTRHIGANYGLRLTLDLHTQQ
jgi:hypothetical protein